MQTNNLITTEKNETKSPPLLHYGSIEDDPQLDWVNFQFCPTPPSIIMKIGRELLEWATNNKDALKISTFFVVRGIDRDTYTRWQKRVPEFKRMYSLAIQAIGDRREALAFKKKASESIALATMGMYDPEYREFLEWKAKLAPKNTEEGKNYVVVTPVFPSSPIVPEKKDPT